MKTMTCKQMGGPCNAPLHGETAEEMLSNGAKHLQESLDEEHEKVLTMMEDMQKDPEAGKKWNDDFAKTFALLPED